MRSRTSGVLLIAVLGASFALGQSDLRDQATNQFLAAQKLEAALNEKPPLERSQSEYLKVIRAYERVYLITPHTGYADNALTTMARLYEEIRDKTNAVKTLQYLLREYPQTQFRHVAETDIARLNGIPDTNTKGATVENIRFWEEESTTRIVVDVAGDVSFKQGEAKSPDRVFIDLSPARLNATLKGKEWVVQSPPFEKIRVAQYSDSTVRLVLDGSTMKRVTAFALKDPNRLIIDVAGNSSIKPTPPKPVISQTTPTPPPVTTAAAAPRPPNSIATTAPAPRPNPIATAAAATPKPASIATTAAAVPALATTAAADEAKITPARPTSRGDRSLIRSLGLKISRVVIDAGHGGHDTGSIGPSGLMEKELVLDVAKRLKVLVETELGLEVVMTRTEDTFVPLQNRTEMANKEGADVFVSIHANSSQTRSVRGVETFFLNLNTQSREALETASRENAASELSIHEQQDILEKIMLNDKVDESRELAQHIQAAMSKRKDAGANRGVKQAPFVVLIGANMPSILAEISFITNPQEERLLKTPEYRQQIAESLLKGVRSYSESLSGTKTAKTQEKD